MLLISVILRVVILFWEFDLSNQLLGVVLEDKYRNPTAILQNWAMP